MMMDDNIINALVIQLLWAMPLLVVFSVGVLVGVMWLIKQPLRAGVGVGIIMTAAFGFLGNLLLAIQWAYGYIDDGAVISLNSGDYPEEFYLMDMVYLLLNSSMLTVLVLLLAGAALSIAKSNPAVSLHPSLHAAVNVPTDI